MSLTKIVSFGISVYIIRQRTSTSVSSEKMSILLHHFNLHQRHVVSASSVLLLRWFTSHAYVMNLLYFAMQRYTTCSLLRISAILFDKNSVSSSFVAVQDNSFLSGAFEMMKRLCCDMPQDNYHQATNALFLT